MITIRAMSSAEGTSATAAPLSVTAHEGDLLVLVVASQFGHLGRPAVPDGWEHAYTDGSDSAGRSGYIAWRWASSVADALDVTWWNPSNRTGARLRGLLLALDGVKRDSIPRITTWSSTPPTIPEQGLILAQEHGTRFTPLDAFTITGGRVIASGAASASASWSTIRAVLTSTGGELNPDPHPATTTAWASLSLTPAVTELARVEVVGAGGAPTPLPAAERKRTAHTVSSLLASRKWTVAHRGGSASWPEMSLLAYTQCVARGVPALEFSFTLTSDGVPVGIHNVNLQGVDPTAPATPISQLTWAQVRKYRTRGEPIIRLQDLQAAFGRDHVLFVDPKHSVGQLSTYLPWLDPERTIIKYFGDATWFAKACRARGFTTWGYFYERHITSGQAAQWARHWDLIGIPWEAGTAAWATARSYGKPILGHICSSQRAVDRALAQGAIGVMRADIGSLPAL